ncbi:MAG: hypothetical protein QM640_03235 [Niabella sp.]
MDVCRSDVFIQNKKPELQLEDQLKDGKESLELNVLKFNDNKFVIGERNFTHKIDSALWQFVPPNLVHVLGETNDNRAFSIVYLDKDSLVLDLLLPVPDKKEIAKITCRFCRINSKEIGGIDIFNASINQWRIQAKREETVQELAARVRGLLKYDYVYIRSLYYSSVPYINTRKFNLPFIYYNGGVGLKNELDARDNFVDFFYTREDAYKALNLLRNAFPKVQYEKKSNYVLEYAEFMKKLAEVI